MAGSNVDTKVFLKIQDIVKDVEQCTVDVERLRPSAVNVKMSFIKDKWMREFFLTDFKIGSISIDTSKSHVAISVPKILLPVSATSPIPVSKGRGARTPTRASGQVAGKIASLPQMKAQKLPSLNVKLANDMSGCCIHGLAITYDGRRLLADCDNSKIKLFSRDTKSLCSLAMPCAPWNIAVIRDREAVVSCGKSKLLVLNTYI